ncbi:MAG TPA: hypothetical protein VGH84_03065 [Steroidobacteraceae bacterium]
MQAGHTELNRAESSRTLAALVRSALDWLATSQTVESGSKPDADGLGEHEGQFARIDPLANQGAQRGIA